MSAAGREDYLRAVEFASPAFIEAALKAYRSVDKGIVTPKGETIFDQQGKPIRLNPAEAVAQAAGFRPERISEASGEHRTMPNVQAHFKGMRDDLYSRYRLARTPEDKQNAIRDMQRFNMEARKYRGLIPPITASSLREAVTERPEKPFMAFGRMMEASP